MNMTMHGFFVAALSMGLAFDVANAAGPELSAMRRAQPAQKLGAPVDLHYFVNGTIGEQPVTSVDLAVVPRLAGSNLDVQVFSSDAMRVVADKRSVTHVARAGASTTYRQSLEVTPLVQGAGLLQVIVTMDVGDARYASVYNIALATPSAPKPKRQLPAR